MHITWHGGLSYTSLNKDKIPSYAGIYVVTNADRKICYVGQANDLQRRFCEHLYDSEPNLGLKRFIRQNTAMFYWTNVAKQEYRDGIELFIYNKVSPVLNDAVPCGKYPIDVTW